MHNTVQAFRYVNLVGYTALGCIATLYWLRHRRRVAMWAAASFGSLGLLELLSLVPNHPNDLAERAVGRVAVALLVLFPYFLFRFTAAFRPVNRRLADGLLLLTAAVIVWTFALPRIPESGEPRPGWFVAYLVALVLVWSLLSTVSALRLWRAGRLQPSVARRRMRLLGFAVALLSLALILIVSAADAHSPLALAAQVLASVSVLAFLLAFEPPRLLRVLWRTREQARLQEAVASLLT